MPRAKKKAVRNNQTRYIYATMSIGDDCSPKKLSELVDEFNFDGIYNTQEEAENSMDSSETSYLFKLAVSQSWCNRTPTTTNLIPVKLK